MIRPPPRTTQSRSSAASDVYKRQVTWIRLPLPPDRGRARQGCRRKEGEKVCFLDRINVPRDCLLVDICIVGNLPELHERARAQRNTAHDGTVVKERGRR